VRPQVGVDANEIAGAQLRVVPAARGAAEPQLVRDLSGISARDSADGSGVFFVDSSLMGAGASSADDAEPGSAVGGDYVKDTLLRGHRHRDETVRLCGVVEINGERVRQRLGSLLEADPVLRFVGAGLGVVGTRRP
jgi:hypothetical protein